MGKEKDYMATTYISIDKSGITRTEGLREKDEYSFCEALDRMRGDKGDFAVIHINVGDKQQLIVASDVCVCRELEGGPEHIATPSGKSQREHIRKINDELPDSFHAYVGFPDSDSQKSGRLTDDCILWNGHLI